MQASMHAEFFLYLLSQKIIPRKDRKNSRNNLEHPYKIKLITIIIIIDKKNKIDDFKERFN